MKSKLFSVFISLAFVLPLFILFLPNNVMAVEPETTTITISDNWLYRAYGRADATASDYTSSEIISASHSSKGNPDFARSIMQYNLSSIPVGATITDIKFNFYIIEANNLDNVYFTESDVTTLNDLSNYALSHYGTKLYDYDIPDTNTGWHNFSIGTSEYFVPGDTEVFIGVITQNDYDDSAMLSWNYWSCYGVSDDTRKPSITITYEPLEGWSPIITNEPSIYANVSVDYNFQFLANETVTWQKEYGPTNLTINSTTGIITWIPELPITYIINISCTNSVNGVDYKNYTVYVYPNWIVSGGEIISDDMLGFIALLALITALNLYAMKSGTGLLSIFALMGLIISASLLWPDSPITTALLMVTVLGNIAITIKTVT